MKLTIDSENGWHRLINEDGRLLASSDQLSDILALINFLLRTEKDEK